MFHSDIFKIFKDCLPDQAKNVLEYFPSGKNTIRIRQSDGQQFIFSYTGPKAWKLETLDQYIASMKGEKKYG